MELLSSQKATKAQRQNVFFYGANEANEGFGGYADIKPEPNSLLPFVTFVSFCKIASVFVSFVAFLLKFIPLGLGFTFPGAACK